jgi:hypothetical protein
MDPSRARKEADIRESRRELGKALTMAQIVTEEKQWLKRDKR